MHKNVLLFIQFLMTCILAAFASADSAEVAVVHTYAEIEQIFKNAAEDTLGVFDIDEVLTYPAEAAFQKANWRENQRFVKWFLKSMTPDQRWLFVNFSLLQGPSKPMEPSEWAVLKRIQEQKVKVIALTASMPGLLGDVYLQEWRYNQLKGLGIDFSGAFPEDPAFCMNHLCCYMGRYPAFFNGILFANGELRLGIGDCNKGDVLVEFLRRKTWKPRKVIFVDDSLENLACVERSLSLFDPDIEYIGVHFKGRAESHSITQEDFQAKWKYVFSLVEAYEAKHPSCAIFSSNVLDR